ncbi:MAG: hypothetical protein ACYDAP_09570 [Thermoplasmataceae archaeon]
MERKEIKRSLSGFEALIPLRLRQGLNVVRTKSSTAAFMMITIRMVLRRMRA